MVLHRFFGKNEGVNKSRKKKKKTLYPVKVECVSQRGLLIRVLMSSANY